jgi:hypothetical protein
MQSALPRSTGLVLASLALSACGGTASPFRPVEAPAEPNTMRAALQHVVLVDLADDADIAAMKADSDAMLPTIPEVRGYICGTPVDIGRGNVAKDYDLGIIVQFATTDAYRAYLEHPVHKELVAKWRPKWARSYIVDFAP